MKSKILGLPAVVLVAWLIAGTAAQAQSAIDTCNQSDTVYQFTMVIDPVTFDGQVYAGGTVSFALPSEALPTENPAAANLIQSVTLNPAPVFDGLTLASVGTAAFTEGNCSATSCSSITEYLLQMPFDTGSPSGAPGQLLGLYTPWIPGAPGPGQFTYPDGTTGFGSGFGLLIGTGCANPGVCGSEYNTAYTGGTIDVVKAPELDASSAAGALSLLVGAVLVLLGRRPARPLA